MCGNMEVNTDFYQDDKRLKCMYVICISGKIGSGKTTFAKKIVHELAHYKIHKKYIAYINIDTFTNHHKKSVYKMLNKTSSHIQKILFFSGSHSHYSTKKTWYELNTYFKPLIIHYIQNVLRTALFRYKYIIFDIAIQKYFKEAVKQKHFPITYITLHNALYTKLFLLKKYRNIPFHKSLKILQQQV